MVENIKNTLKDIMKKAYIYARYSSDMQDAASIDAQIRYCKDFCEREGYEVVDIYIDEAQSATNDNRDDFQRMIDDARNRKDKINAIIVHKFNRFARNTYDSAIHKKLLKDIGIRVVSASQYIDDSPEGKMLEGFLENIDEYYSANLALEVKKGLKEKALKGMHVGGRPPLGYSLNDEKRLVPNDKAIIIRKIFEMIIDGYGKRTISYTLNQLGYRSQTGKRITERTIYDILRNKKYLGTYTCDLGNETIEIEGTHEAIISKEVWEKAHKVSKSKRKPRISDENELYILTGKMRCGECGEAYTGGGFKTWKSYGENVRTYYYTCVGNRSKYGCNNGSLNKIKIEKYIIDYIFDNILTDDVIERIAVRGEEMAREEYRIYLRFLTSR